MDLPQIDVVALQPPQRSVKIAKQRAPRRVDDALAVPITNPALVAITTSSRFPSSRTSLPTMRSASPAPYAAAVSIKVPPASQNISSRA